MKTVYTKTAQLLSTAINITSIDHVVKHTNLFTHCTTLQKVVGNDKLIMQTAYNKWVKIGQTSNIVLYCTQYSTCI
jgi:hypothetical protein